MEAVNALGVGRWRLIQQTFGHRLGGRSNSQLKDKWQNLLQHKHVKREAEGAPWALIEDALYDSSQS